MQSFSVQILPYASDSRYWALIVRDGEVMPEPCAVRYSGDIPYKYLLRGEDELLPGDALFEGELENSRFARWTYWLTVITENGEKLYFQSGNLSIQKQQMKDQGMPPELLRGSGDIAALVRILHGVRLGLEVTP